MWFGSGHILLRLSVNMIVSMVIVLVYSITNSSVHNTALRMYVYPGSLATNF